jgi:hypothetical protein
MKRLFNEHSVAPCNDSHAALLHDKMEGVLDEVWDVVEAEDLCPRDAELLCLQEVSLFFSEKIVGRNVMKVRAKRQEETG